MAKDAYTLKKKKDTEELHLFKGTMKETGGCTSAAKSICKKMAKVDSSENVFTCKDEKTARAECAKKGRTVCGTCVSHLYATYD